MRKGVIDISVYNQSESELVIGQVASLTGVSLSDYWSTIEYKRVATDL